MYIITMHTGVGDEVFKAKRNPVHDKILQLPWVLFMDFPNLLKRKDWAKSMKNITDYTGIKLDIKSVDGRSKAVKGLDWFSWRRVFWLHNEYVIGLEK